MLSMADFLMHSSTDSLPQYAAQLAHLDPLTFDEAALEAGGVQKIFHRRRLLRWQGGLRAQRTDPDPEPDPEPEPEPEVDSIRKADIVASKTAPGGGALVQFQTPHVGFGCGMCNSAVAAGATMFGCRDEDFDLCSECHADRVSEPEVKAMPRQGPKWGQAEPPPPSPAEYCRYGISAEGLLHFVVSLN